METPIKSIGYLPISTGFSRISEPSTGTTIHPPNDLSQCHLCTCSFWLCCNQGILHCRLRCLIRSDGVETAVLHLCKNDPKKPRGFEATKLKGTPKTKLKPKFCGCVFFAWQKSEPNCGKGTAETSEPNRSLLTFSGVQWLSIICSLSRSLICNNQWKMIVGRLLSFWDGLFSGANC